AVAGRPSAGRVAEAPEAVDGAGQGELGRPETGHEPPPADPAGLLQRPQHAVQPGEAARDALAEDGLPGEDAVAVEQLECPAVGHGGGRRRGLEQRGDERPAIAARSGASVSLVTSPAQTRSHRAGTTTASSAVPAASTRSG